MSDYRVTVKVQNGRLWTLIQSKGFKNVAQFCADSGINQNMMGNLLAMKISPQTEEGEWRKIVLQISDYFGVLPDDLFTERQMEALTSNVVERMVSERDIDALLENTQHDVDRLIDIKNAGQKLIESSVLRNREKRILHYIYSDDKSLDEIAEIEGVSNARIQQIRNGALRKLRHPDVCGQFKVLD